MDFKKLVAFTMAATMVLGSSVTAFASSTETDITADVATGSAKEITGTGSEIFVNKNVMKVTVPTTLTNLFNYKLDPQGLVAATGKYGKDAISGDATGLIFKNAAASGGTATISHESDPVKITNKSSIPVEMGVTVTLTAASGGIALNTMATENDFSGDNAAKTIYLGLKASNDLERALGASPITPKNILLSGVDQYEVKVDASGAYSYAAKSDAKFDDFEFSIVGAMNPNLPNSTWASVSADGTTVTVKDPPAISVKFDLTAVKDALELGAGFIGDDLYFWQTNAPDLAKDGGFGDTKPSAVTINGKTVATADYEVSVGYGLVKFDKIASLFGVAAADVANLTAEEKAAIKACVKAVKATTGTGATAVTFYGEL